MRTNRTVQELLGFMANTGQHAHSFLCSSDSQVALDFARVALNIILKGQSAAKGFPAAARRLHTTVDAVQEAVSLLCNAFIRAARSNLSSDRMSDYLSHLGYQDPARQALADYFSEQLQQLRSTIAIPVLASPCYRSLEWRLDVQIASRSLRNQSQPSFLLKLTTMPNYLSGAMQDHNHVHYLEADYKTLKEVCKQLEQALAESKASHTRRILRQLN